jgi:ABC-type polar amino acid transport system ATPase subunit
MNASDRSSAAGSLGDAPTRGSTGDRPPRGSSNTPDDIIRCEALTRRYGSFTALESVDFRVRRGEVVCIVGPSGGGKSTLLRTINGLESFDEGSIVVDGIRLPGSRGDVTRIRREVGMVFQSFNLFPHMTVRRNVALAPMRARGVSRDEANARAERLLRRVGIADQIDKYPEQLSGGQQQRVAIARALAMEPRVMLFDEPTSALDAEMVSEVLQVIREMVGTGMTMVIVTHELGFAREAADRIVFMESGTIAVEAPPADFFANTTDRRLASFLSKVL